MHTRPDPGAGRARLDVIGLALLAPALAGILLGLSNLSEDGGIGHAGVSSRCWPGSRCSARSPPGR